MKRILFFAALSLTFINCSKNKNANENFAQVKTITATKSTESTTLETFGTITYNKKNDITALVEGTIYELSVKEGDKVEQGQVLLRMKNIQYEIQKTESQNQVDSAKARLQSAKNNLVESTLSANSRIIALENSRLNLEQKEKEFSLIQENLRKNEMLFEAEGISQSGIEQMRLEAQSAQTEIAILKKQIQIEELGMRNEDLIAAGIVPSTDKEIRKQQLIDLNTRSAKIEIEIAQVNLHNAEQNLKLAKTLMENLTVRATSSGIVGALYYENGEHVTQNEKILTIVDMSLPYALVNIQEKDMRGIGIGSQAKIQIASLNHEQNAQIEFIGTVADSQTGNFNVKIPIQNSEQNIKLGMFATCSIKTNSSGDFFILPESVVLKRDGNKIHFYSVQNEILVSKQCVVEMERDGNFYIEDGIINGEKIVVTPSSTLKEGMHVKII